MIEEQVFSHFFVYSMIHTRCVLLGVYAYAHFGHALVSTFFSVLGGVDLGEHLTLVYSWHPERVRFLYILYKVAVEIWCLITLMLSI